MLEVLSGLGLSTAAGLNAYIPLLAIGILARFTDFIDLPGQWQWLQNPWVLVILCVLLALEIVADKIPAVDTVNDWVQTFVRPAAGGIVFGSTSTSSTVAVTDPASFFHSHQWVPIAIGVGIALLTHATKATVRPVANTASFGAAAPVLSTAEDGASVILSATAIFLPVLVVVLLGAVIVAFGLLFRRMRKGRVPKDPALMLGSD